MQHRRGSERVRPGWQTPVRPSTVCRATRAVAVVSLWTATTGGLAALVGDAAGAVRATGPARLEDAVTLLAGGLALAAAWWLAVAVLASLTAALLARRGASGGLTRAAEAVSRRTTPAALRRAVVLAVGLSITAGPALAATGPVAGPTAAATERAATTATQPLDPAWAGAATPTGPATPGTGPAVSPTPDLDPGWAPSAPAAGRTAREQVALPGPSLRATAGARAEVVVRRGDTLWSIVERHLGRYATAAEVAAEWPRWYAANADVVGSDPDRLLPGQLLRPPGVAAGAQPVTAATDGRR